MTDTATAGAVAMAAMVSLVTPQALASLAAFPPRSIMRVICHCWAIDRTLLTTSRAPDRRGNQEHDTEDQRHHHRHLGLDGIGRRRVELGLMNIEMIMITGRM